MKSQIANAPKFVLYRIGSLENYDAAFHGLTGVLYRIGSLERQNSCRR